MTRRTSDAHTTACLIPRNTRTTRFVTSARSTPARVLRMAQLYRTLGGMSGAVAAARARRSAALTFRRGCCVASWITVTRHRRRRGARRRVWRAQLWCGQVAVLSRHLREREPIPSAAQRRARPGARSVAAAALGACDSRPRATPSRSSDDPAARPRGRWAPCSRLARRCSAPASMHLVPQRTEAPRCAKSDRPVQRCSWPAGSRWRCHELAPSAGVENIQETKVHGQ
jgi:hypothetical protein